MQEVTFKGLSGSSTTWWMDYLLELLQAQLGRWAEKDGLSVEGGSFKLLYPAVIPVSGKAEPSEENC